MTNFWLQLPKPFTVLAPMDGVTDVVFRQVIAKIGKPDVFFTEFTPVDGILSKGKKNVITNLKFLPNEQPIVAQIWGADPEHFYKASKYISKLGFAGIDINMGCPDKTTMRYGACGALINVPKLAGEIIKATREGAKEVPISVKTRIGFDNEKIDEWIAFLLEQKLPALTVHLRTVEEQSKVDAHWELMPKLTKLRDRISPNTLIVGNGDLWTLKDIQDKEKNYGCDGYMVGRGVLHNPWMLNPAININQLTVRERLDQYTDHIKMFTKIWGKDKNPAIIKKFCKAYINNFPEASNLRIELMETKTTEELMRKIAAIKKLQ